jgi:hypothetical protein
VSDTGIRKTVLVVEEIRADGGREVDEPLRIAAAAAVVKNPFAGRFVEDLQPIADAYCLTLGELLTELAVGALGVPAEGVGKGALVGLGGEVEHGSAVIHNLLFGNFVRDRISGSALLPAAEKVGAAGAPLDLAIKHKDDHTVRSHHQTFEVRIADAPRDDEIVIWVAVASGGRPQARLPVFASELQQAGAAAS